MKKTKPLKRTGEAHTSKSKIGMGDNYGSGIKNPVGKIRDIMGITDITPKKMGKPPKSLA
jgi:hypothetical protein